MPHYSADRCTVCGDICDRSRITVKRAVFSRKGEPNRIGKSRTTHWLCPACLVKDPEYNLESYSGPGHRSPGLERVRARNGKLESGS